MVVGTAAAARATHVGAIGNHCIVGSFGKGHLYTLDPFVVTDDRPPVVAHLGGLGRACHEPSVVPGCAAVHVFVVGPGEPFHVLGAGCHELDTGSHAVVHVGEEVIALVPGHLADVHGQPERHGGMSAVAAALLHLS